MSSAVAEIESRCWTLAKPDFARWADLQLPCLDIWLLGFRWSCSYIVVFVWCRDFAESARCCGRHGGPVWPSLVLIHNSLPILYSYPVKSDFDNYLCWFHELKNRNRCKAQLVWTLESRALRSSTASGSPKSTLFFFLVPSLPTYTACMITKWQEICWKRGSTERYVIQIGPPQSHFISATAWRTWYMQ